MKKKKCGIKVFGKKIYLYVLIQGFLLTLAFLCFFGYMESMHKRESVYHVLELYGVRMEALLNGLFQKTDILESLIITNGGVVAEDSFNNLAQALMEGTGIRAIQYLPDGKVVYCYPLEGNESAIGNDVFSMPERKEDALLAVKTKRIALSGPYELTQGGLGLVARNPIFLTDSNGMERFWGFSVVVLDLPEALDPLMLSEMNKEGLEYQLSCEVNGERVIIKEDAESGFNFDGKDGRDYAEAEINVPNHVWDLKAVPAGGWINRRLLVLEGIIGISFSIMCAFIVYLLERQAKQMKEFASTDELTGLFNRHHLNEYMNIRCRDEKSGFALCYLDLNRFKRINDTLGHAGGDAVLVETGRRMKAAMRKEDSVYRIGGDEFIVLMEHVESSAVCLEQLKVLLEELEKPYSYENKPVEITASVGYARFPEDGINFEALMKRADREMYRDKEKQKR